MLGGRPAAQDASVAARVWSCCPSMGGHAAHYLSAGAGAGAAGAAAGAGAATRGALCAAVMQRQASCARRWRPEGLLGRHEPKEERGAGCIQGVQGALPCKWGQAGLLRQQPKYDCVLEADSEADPEADRGPRVELQRT